MNPLSQDILNAVIEQRTNASNDVAVLQATVKAYERKVAELQAKVDKAEADEAAKKAPAAPVKAKR